MLRKIKKARDLVFTTNKRRTRRNAVASQENICDQQTIHKELYPETMQSKMEVFIKTNEVFDNSSN